MYGESGSRRCNGCYYRLALRDVAGWRDGSVLDGELRMRREICVGWLILSLRDETWFGSDTVGRWHAVEAGQFVRR